MLTRLLIVAVGGGLGSGVRYLTSIAGWRLFGVGFPAATLAVNLLGCLLIGLVFALAEERGAFGPLTRVFLMVGFLGGLTTFSTFALETVDYANLGSTIVVLFNILANNVGGLLMVVAGMHLARAF